MKRAERISIFIMVAVLTVEIIVCCELLKKSDIEMQGLVQTNADLQNEIDELKEQIADYERKISNLTNEIEIQRTKQIETQRTNRGQERPHYPLSEEERALVESVVMAEAGGESYEGQALVAQCILNACTKDNIRPAEAIKKYAYAKSRPKPSESVKQAVSAVFDKGELVTDEPIIYFYAPALVKSKFHESQIFALAEGGHKFFCAKD